MRAEHIEFLVEEPSMETFLAAILPKMLADEATFTIHTHQGKTDLLDKLESRLKGYAKWLPDSIRIVILVDRDADDCRILKSKMENAAASAGVSTRSRNCDHNWRCVNRIVIEELEAWFFGAWTAVRAAYPRVPETIPNQTQYRDCDAISGGTWEALERVLQRAGYYSGGLRKVEVADRVGNLFEHAACTSESFRHFREAVMEAIVEPR